MSKDSIPIFSGNHFEMGFQQGKHFKDNIRQGFITIQRRPEFLTQKPKYLPQFLFWSLAKKKALNWLKPYFTKFAPNQAERVKGIAQGAESKEGWIYLLMSTELVLDSPEYVMPLESCTDIGIKKTRSANDSSLIARNFDYGRFILPFLQVRHNQPKGGDYFSTFDITASPLAGTFNGMNEHGVFIGTNECSTTQPRQMGLPCSILIQEALEQCTSTEEVVNYFKSKPRGSTNALIVGDAQDDIRVVEYTYDKVLSRSPESSPEKGWIVQTNHYIQPELQKVESPLNAIYGPKAPKIRQGTTIGRSTLARYGAATHFLTVLGEQKISAEKLKAILSDHSTDPTERYACLCRHDLETVSAASMIANLQERSLLYCIGNPCEHNYQKFQFKQ
jgi:isopenicillin-N N-acyltransferase-like protein